MILIAARVEDRSRFWSVRVRLSELHRKEERADARDRDGRERPRQERPPLHREGRVREILARRVRSVFRNRDKTYELRDLPPQVPIADCILF